MHANSINGDEMSMMPKLVIPRSSPALKSVVFNVLSFKSVKSRNSKKIDKFIRDKTQDQLIRPSSWLWDFKIQNFHFYPRWSRAFKSEYFTAFN